MERSCLIIDLCVKSEKSDDTSTTIPLDDNTNAQENPPGDIIEDPTYKRKYTEQWLSEQNDSTTMPFASISTQMSDSSQEMPVTISVEDTTNINDNLPDAIGYSTNNNRKYTEQWISEQNDIPTAVFNDLPPANLSFAQIPPVNISGQEMPVAIPTEIAELVNEECVIKLINHLVIYAFNKVTETDLLHKLISVTPDVDPQLNYRINLGFGCIYERCVVLFYEALLELTLILNKFTAPHQEIVILWMYDTIENISRAHGVDSSFLRNENHIETLLKDFSDSHMSVPTPENVFYNVYQKMQPREIMPSENQLTTAAIGPPRKRGKRGPRQPRAKSNQKDSTKSSS